MEKIFGQRKKYPHVKVLHIPKTVTGKLDKMQSWRAEKEDPLEVGKS